MAFDLLFWLDPTYRSIDRLLQATLDLNWNPSMDPVRPRKSSRFGMEFPTTRSAPSTRSALPLQKKCAVCKVHQQELLRLGSRLENKATLLPSTTLGIEPKALVSWTILLLLTLEVKFWHPQVTFVLWESNCTTRMALLSPVYILATVGTKPQLELEYYLWFYSTMAIGIARTGSS